jgi:hypothetical protein
MLKELKAPPKYSNYKRSRQYKEALQDKGINIEAINAESTYIIREDRLLFIENKPEENTDLKDISINNDFKFFN